MPEQQSDGGAQGEAQSDMQLLVIETLNKAIHELLSVDPDTANAFAKLIGKVYCIALTLPAVTLYLVPEPEGFRVEANSQQPPDVTLSGSVFAFASAFARLSRKGAAGVLSDGPVTMHGDAEAGQALQQVCTQFDFDWEQLIARVIGDTPARKAGNIIRATADWASQTAELGQSNMVDYLQEEKKVLVTAPGMQRFEAAVKMLRADTDRLEQRIQRLRQPGKR